MIKMLNNIRQSLKQKSSFTNVTNNLILKFFARTSYFICKLSLSNLTILKVNFHKNIKIIDNIYH